MMHPITSQIRSPLLEVTNRTKMFGGRDFLNPAGDWIACFSWTVIKSDEPWVM